MMHAIDPNAAVPHVISPTAAIERFITDVPDFPKPGIVFKDMTPLLADPAALALAVELMANPYRTSGVTHVIGAESRGFIFGTAIARSLNAGFVPVRKPGKLPRTARGVDYELEYGTDRLEMHEDAITKGDRVLLVDDLLATGGTMAATVQLASQSGAELIGLTVLMELAFLNGRGVLGDAGERLHAVIRYD